MSVLTTPDLAATRQVLDSHVGAAFGLAEDRKGRDPLAMSLSKLGGCTREAAYRLSGTAPDAAWEGRGEARAATLGTWQHRGLLPNLRLRLRGARTEVPVRLAGSGLDLPGHTDLWWRRRPIHGGDGVVDVKTVREYGLSRVRQYGPQRLHTVQVDAYALALKQTRGANVRWTSLIYLDRADGQHETIVRPFGPAEAAAVLERLAELAVAARNPQMAERTERGPGLSYVCDGCPWLRQCWGEQAEPGQIGGQNALIHEGQTTLVSALAMYDEARARESAAKRDKEFARAMLEGEPAGEYGAFELTWGKDSPGGAIDKAKAWDALDAEVDLAELADAHGVALPKTRPRKGSIGVGRID